MNPRGESKSKGTARPDSEARDLKDDRDSGDPIALRKDEEACDKGARAAHFAVRDRATRGARERSSRPYVDRSRPWPRIE